MTTTRLAGALSALALLAAPSVAAAHGGHHHGRHHHRWHHVKKAHAGDVTGAATGTVQSFADGQLTIALPSGKTFTAAVTDRTSIWCRTAQPSPTATTANHDPGDDDQGDDRDDDAGRCGTADLVAGAKVLSATLSLYGGDATWKKVALLK